MADRSSNPSPRRTSLRLAALAAVLSLAGAWPGLAAAETTEPAAGGVEVAAAAPAGPPSTLATSTPPVTFRSVQRGLLLDAEYSSSRLTQGVALSAGVRTVGLEASLDDPWLLRWDLSASARGGLAIVQPFAWLAGVRAFAGGEVGYRLLPQAWSPLVTAGGYLRGDFFQRWLIVEEVGTLRDSFASLEAAPRFGLGASYLDQGRSLRAVAFAQPIRRWTNYMGTLGATSLGLSIGYDLADRLALLAEATLSTEPPASTPGLALVTLRSSRVLELSARKVFRSGSWVGLGVVLSEQTNQLRYLDTGLTLKTVSPGTFVVIASYGLHLGD